MAKYGDDLLSSDVVAISQAPSLKLNTNSHDDRAIES